MDRQIRTVLCVSVDPEVMEPMVEALEPLYKVRRAATADAALAVISGEVVDLLIIDSLADTERCTRLLKSCQCLHPFCKIILIEGNVEQPNSIASLVHDRCQKPVDLAMLLEMVHSLIHDTNTAVFLDKMTDQSVKYSLGGGEGSDCQKQYARFLETFKSGVCLADGDGIVRYVNRRGCELLGVKTGEELIGTSLSSLFRLAKESERQFLQKYIRRDWTPDSLDVICPNGTEMTMQANITFSENIPPHIVTVLFSPCSQN